MQRHLVQAHTATHQPRQQIIGEVQTRCGCRHRTLVVREQGLVVGLVLLVGRAPGGDIGRQRHLAPLGNGLIQHRAMEGK